MTDVPNEAPPGWSASETDDGQPRDTYEAATDEDTTPPHPEDPSGDEPATEPEAEPVDPESTEDAAEPETVTETVTETTETTTAETSEPS